jgi:cytoskeleton protein RodZ
MADVARRLRSAREAAGLTIDDLSARTKIKPSSLLAIEQGAFEQLPGEFFTRAFLRTCARELHVPVEEVMADYEGGRVPLPPKPTPAPVRPVLVEPRHGGWPLITIAAATVVLVFMMTQTDAPSDREPGAVGTAGRVAAAAPPVATPLVPDTLTIEIRPARPLWVTATADGKRVLFRILQPGERVAVEARETMTFRVGDAGAFDYLLNGAPGKPPGRDGEVREFTITRATQREFSR